ncbi:MAG: TAT-variant-translocated molybdopterin oxidoreductase [Verrucomicrobiota bacterium]
MSKRIWQHPEIPADETTISWRSMGQLEDTPSFRNWLEREFPRGAAEMANEEEMETSRRSFLKLMGASTALAGFGLASCRRPESYIVPYTKAPEWVIPGQATYYASAMPRSTGATPLVVTTFEGRPTKVAPNTLHPDSDGTDAFAQASILDLYSPSRSRRFLKSGKPVDRGAFETVLADVAKNSGSRLGFLFGNDDSPTRNRLVADLKKKFSAAKFYQYEALGANTNAVGAGLRLVANFEKADRIVALDCDFLGLDPMGATAPFYARRKPEGKDYHNLHPEDASAMNRFYAVEAAFSLTGGIADHRLRVPASEVLLVAAAIAAGLGVDGGRKTDNTKYAQWVAPLVADLEQHPGRSLVLAGSRTSPELQQLAFAINKALGNVGEGKPLAAYQLDHGKQGLADLKNDIDGGTIDKLVLLGPSNPVFDAPADLDFATSLAKLEFSIHLGERSDATAHACTWHVPAAHYLESWGDTRTARGIYTVVQPMILPLYPDCVSEIELLTALLSEDGKLLNGEGEKGAPSPAYTAVRATFDQLAEPGDTRWKALLRDGFLAASKYPAAAPSIAAEVNVAKALDDAVAAAPTKDSLQIIFATDASVYDGRWIDNAWLQEAPDPISKLTWDNAALIAPKTAKELGVYDTVQEVEPETKALGILPIKGKFAAVGPDGEGENRKQRMIEVSVNGKKIEIPVLIGFGLAENTVILPLGYGQAYDKDHELGYKPVNEAHTGLVGVNRGFNVYPLRTSTAPYFATGGKVRKLDKTYLLALVQEHNAMYGRALAREISTFDAKDGKGDFDTQLSNVKLQGNDAHAPKNIYLYKPESSSVFHPGKDGKAQPLLSDPLHQWGMSIDLSACIGCTACLIACQAENNIPVVGKEQVAKGREMHWVRMDRYYAVQKDNDFDPDNPAVLTQPVSCVQCESAPCETVCPVNATIHTEDGLNAMAYNRCIGTRYCANNCPYKARRFNFFDYNKRNPLIKHNLYRGPLGETTIGDPDHLQKNPNVTVRMRGVMEKCTYCVQRLKEAVIHQKRRQKKEVVASGKTSPEVRVTEKTLRVSADGLRVACQEACSADAITFGNLLDIGEKLDRTKKLERNYDLLHYIGTRPRTGYLARVKNPNPDMPDAKFVGKATIHMA